MRLLRTVRYLRLRQIIYRLVRRGPLRRIAWRVGGSPWVRFRRGMEALGNGAPPPAFRPILFACAPDPPGLIDSSGLRVDGVAAPGSPDEWSTGSSPFRVYRLHAQLFAAHSASDREHVWRLILRYLTSLERDPDAWHTHPLSLRLIHWVRFLSADDDKRESRPAVILAMRLQARFLLRHIEWETDGNHLIDNAAALVVAGVALADPDMARRGRRLLLREATRQLLPNQTHEERSPMYHRLVTERLLDAVSALRGFPDDAGFSDSSGQLCGLAQRYLAGSELWERRDAALNDTFPGMGPSHAALVAYAREMGLGEHLAEKTATKPHPDEFMLHARGSVRVLFDTAPIGARHVAGHAHADSLQLLVWSEGRPVVVDTASSSYDGDSVRDYERSTRAHNTVGLHRNGSLLDSSELWGVFRVGRRASVTERRIVEDTPQRWIATAAHDGYREFGLTHRRTVHLDDHGLQIRDELVGRDQPNGVVVWILSPDIRPEPMNAPTLFRCGPVVIELQDVDHVEVRMVHVATGYAARTGAYALHGFFRSSSQTLFRPR